MGRVDALRQKRSGAAVFLIRLAVNNRSDRPSCRRIRSITNIRWAISGSLVILSVLLLPHPFTARAKSTPTLHRHSVDGALANTPIISMNETWKYLDDGSNQATAWRDIAFDDSSWDAGLAELGYGNGDEATSP